MQTVRLSFSVVAAVVLAGCETWMGYAPPGLEELPPMEVLDEAATAWSQPAVVPDALPSSFYWSGISDPDWTVSKSGIGVSASVEQDLNNSLLRLFANTQAQQAGFVSATSPAISTLGADQVELTLNHKLTCMTDLGACRMRIQVFSANAGESLAVYVYERDSGGQELPWNTLTLNLPHIRDDVITVSLTVETQGDAMASWRIDDVSVVSW